MTGSRGHLKSLELPVKIITLQITQSRKSPRAHVHLENKQLKIYSNRYLPEYREPYYLRLLYRDVNGRRSAGTRTLCTVINPRLD